MRSVSQNSSAIDCGDVLRLWNADARGRIADFLLKANFRTPGDPASDSPFMIRIAV
jgi:hypothetical protein